MDTISFEEFKKLDLRVGTIEKAEEIEGADMLWKLTVNLGPSTDAQDEQETRTVAAGVKKHYTPEELEGRQVPIVANLEPKTLKGVESQGMVLMAVGKDDTPVLLSPIDEVEPGTIVR